MDCLSRQTSTRRQSVLTSIKDIGNKNAADDDIFLNISNCSSNLSGLCQATTLLSSVKGGKSEDGSDDDDVDGNITLINNLHKKYQKLGNRLKFIYKINSSTITLI